MKVPLAECAGGAVWALPCRCSVWSAAAQADSVCNIIVASRRGMPALGPCVDGALRSSTMFGMATIAVGAVMCLACWCSHCLTTAGPDVVREAGPDQGHGLDTRDPKKVFPPRRPTHQQ
jgi:hypothetical protein